VDGLGGRGGGRGHRGVGQVEKARVGLSTKKILVHEGHEESRRRFD